jgi:hypothetical protein
VAALVPIGALEALDAMGRALPDMAEAAEGLPDVATVAGGLRDPQEEP